MLNDLVLVACYLDEEHFTKEINEDVTMVIIKRSSTFEDLSSSLLGPQSLHKRRAGLGVGVGRVRA